MMINYNVFLRLYNEAFEYDDLEMYIAERGWQDWMDKIQDVSKISEILTTIYDMARGTILQSRELIGVSRAEFCRRYNMPIRTVENWDAEKCPINDYTKSLLCYAILSDIGGMTDDKE